MARTLLSHSVRVMVLKSAAHLQSPLPWERRAKIQHFLSAPTRPVSSSGVDSCCFDVIFPSRGFGKDQSNVLKFLEGKRTAPWF